MKICIVGASGFIGSSLHGFFATHGIEVVTVSSNNTPKGYGYNDLEKADTCIEILSDIDTVFYLCSANQHETENNPGTSVKIILGPLGHILRAKSNLPKLKLIYFSTAQVFNSVAQEKTITNNTDCAPNNYYGLFHLYGENMLNYSRDKYQSSNALSLRLTNSYGFLCSQTSNWQAPVVNDFIRSAHLEHTITMKSDGSPFRDFIEMSTLMEVCLKLTHENEIPKNLIVGSGLTVNLAYVANRIQNIFATKFGKNIELNTSGEIKEPKIKASPRYMVDDNFCKRQSADEIDKFLEKAILDFERFI